MTPEKPSEEEERYFKEEELRWKKQAEEEWKERMATEEAQRLRDLHWMRCPRDGTLLRAIQFMGVEIDYSPTTGGVWLDPGELEHILDKSAEEQSSFFVGLLRIFGGRKGEGLPVLAEEAEGVPRDEEEARTLEELHWMHSPKDGTELRSMEFMDIELFYSRMGGVWLDKGKLEELIQRSNEARTSFIASLLKFVWRGAIQERQALEEEA